MEREEKVRRSERRKLVKGWEENWRWMLKVDGVNSFWRRLDSRYGYLMVHYNSHIYYGDSSSKPVPFTSPIVDSLILNSNRTIYLACLDALGLEFQMPNLFSRVIPGCSSSILHEYL